MEKIFVALPFSKEDVEDVEIVQFSCIPKHTDSIKQYLIEKLGE